jgi:hypothetical protein
MIGGSYVGQTQWLAASQVPKALKTIVPHRINARGSMAPMPEPKSTKQAIQATIRVADVFAEELGKNRAAGTYHLGLWLRGIEGLVLSRDVTARANCD